ncbi:MAG: hypothetical protein U9N42_05890 [Campylobacterota bacterium]|nr:hypothetical protein [Campylobacterota bacterium]
MKLLFIHGWSEQNPKATKTIEQMCEYSWKWQMNNPDGYEK